MSDRLRVYVGWDERPVEAAAYDVALKSARDFDCDITPIREDILRSWGVLTRPTDRRNGIWDFHSNAPQSTSFAISRFVVPLLCHSGWALFVDADVVFLSDPHPILEFCNPTKAVSVVKHSPLLTVGKKMDGQVQTAYPRKNWSSVVLWNCSHPANRRINLSMLNQWPGRDLHAFSWLHDSEIGELPPRWNWLVGVQPEPLDPVIAHFTLGTPNTLGHEDTPHADLWWRHSQR